MPLSYGKADQTGTWAAAEKGNGEGEFEGLMTSPDRSLMTRRPPSPDRSLPRLILRSRLIGGALGLCVAFLLTWLIISSPKQCRHSVAHARKASVRWATQSPLQFAFISWLIICVLVLFGIPLTPIELVLATCYTLRDGFLIAYTAKLAGCVTSSLLGRSACSGMAAKLLADHELVRSLAFSTTQSPWKMCTLVRAAYIPLVVKNYGLAALDAPLVPDMVTLVVIEFLYTFTSVYLGVALRDIGGSLTTVGLSNSSQTLLKMGAAPISLVIIAIITTRAMKRVAARARSTPDLSLPAPAAAAQSHSFNSL